ncbi:tetratricopeptide repeat protein [Pseudotenacibaculum haliotis]|uniref:Tetratricopeptide repeat protein n=1 Tax=Pseudotenacibaculum haliotis TaxID=1862138 RepID=A0ABW5LM77_9FLAO
MDELTKNYDRILTNNYNLSYSFFEKEISNNNSSFLKIMLIYKYLNDKNTSKAKELISKLDFDKNSFFESLMKMNEGILKIEEGKKNQGIELLKDAVKLDTNNENKWVRLELFTALKDEIPYEAWKYLEEALKIDPDFYWARVEKSFEFDEFANCIEIIEILKDLPETYNDSDAFNMLGVAQINCRDIQGAKESLKKSIKIKETSNNCFSLGQFYHEYFQNFREAERLYKRSLELEPSNSDAINAYSWLLYDLGKYDEAERKILTMLEISKDQEIFNQIMNFYLLNENLLKAREYLNQSIKVNMSNYMNEGYKIIINIVEGSEYKNLFEAYKKKYEEYDVQWLKDQIAFFLENRNK